MVNERKSSMARLGSKFQWIGWEPGRATRVAHWPQPREGKRGATGQGGRRLLLGGNEEARKKSLGESYNANPKQCGKGCQLRLWAWKGSHWKWNYIKLFVSKMKVGGTGWKWLMVETLSLLGAFKVLPSSSDFAHARACTCSKGGIMRAADIENMLKLCR